MKRIFVIKTYNLLFPSQGGFIMNDVSKNLSSIKIFKSPTEAEKFLSENSERLRDGWIHIIQESYMKEIKTVDHVG